MCKICSKLTTKTPERCHWRRSCNFIVNFEHISHIVLVFPLLTFNADWDSIPTRIDFSNQDLYSNHSNLPKEHQRKEVYNGKVLNS